MDHFMELLLKVLMTRVSSLLCGLVLFPRYLQLQSPLWTGDWEDKEVCGNISTVSDLVVL